MSQVLDSGYPSNFPVATLKEWLKYTFECLGNRDRFPASQPLGEVYTAHSYRSKTNLALSRTVLYAFVGDFEDLLAKGSTSFHGNFEVTARRLVSCGRPASQSLLSTCRTKRIENDTSDHGCFTNVLLSCVVIWDFSTRCVQVLVLALDPQAQL